MGNLTIDEIHAMTADEVMSLPGDVIDVKGHEVKITDLGGPWGLSALVCVDGRHIYHADDFQLHHGNRAPGELADKYVEWLSGKLFTEEEITGPAESYNVQKAKGHYLHNYYPQRRNRVSMFGKAPEGWEDMKADMVFSPVGFCWFWKRDKEFARHLSSLYRSLKAAERDDYEYMKGAFLHEMRNHEYQINWQGDWDVISCFAKVDYADAGTEWYLEQTGWDEEVKRAYRDAKAEYYRMCEENGWW